MRGGASLCASFFLFGCSIAYIPLFHCHFSNSKEGVPRPISHLGCWCLLDPYRHVHLKDDTRAKTFVQSTGEVKFSNTSYTIHVPARSLNLSLGQIIIESIPRPCSAKISRCHIHDVTVHLRGNSALQPQTFPQHYIHGVAICACSSTAASSLHYILVVGLW